MAKKNFNIPALYQQVFGISGVRFAIPALLENVGKTAAEAALFAAGQRLNELVNTNVPANKQYQGIQTIPLPETSIQSVLGTPIYEQITLNVPAIVSNGVVTAPASTYTFPDWPLFDITPHWMVVKKNVQNGGVGTVKEFIGQDDFDITIRGFLINYASQDYPEDLLTALWQVINCKQSIGITSRVFNLLDIHNIVILDAKFPGVEGYMNMQPFELTCVSDTPIELLIKSVKTQQPITPGL
jgi:hypothetical protein